MFLIGLTGGIAAGKSTVAALWQELGGIEIDADALARQVVERGAPGADLIRERFGAEFFDSDGNLDRKELAALVFNDAQAKKDLEGIVHPLVQEKARQALASLPTEAMAIYTVPLLVEANVSLPFDVVVTVEAPEELRVQRLVDTRNMTEAEAVSRIKNQAQPIERVSRADFVLNSNQGLDQLLEDAKGLWAEFLRRAEDKN
ncbi:MAG: dephospho-CoA kinase [Rhodoluna sp.]